MIDKSWIIKEERKKKYDGFSIDKTTLENYLTKINLHSGTRGGFPPPKTLHLSAKFFKNR
jgi:hypothetical protein